MADYRELFRTAPDTPGGRYMRLFWHPVCRSLDLKPGWAKPIQVMSDKFTLYRGEGGAAHVVAFRCAHRDKISSEPILKIFKEAFAERAK